MRVQRRMPVAVRLLTYLRPHWPAVLLAYVCLAGSVAFAILVPLLHRWVIDVGIAQRDREMLALLALLIVAAAAARSLFTYGQSYLSEYLSQHVAFALRNDLYQKIQSLSFSFHDRAQTGQLMSRTTVDVEVARQFLGVSTLRFAHTVAMFVFVSGVMVHLNWELALLTFLTLPLVTGRTIYVSRKLRPMWRQVQEQTGQYSNVLQENLAGIRVVKVFGREQEQHRKFQEANWAVRELSLAANRISAFNQPLMVFLLNMTTALILWYGGRHVIQDGLTLGTVVAFVEFRTQLAIPVRMLGMIINVIARASGAAERIFEVLDTQSEVQERPDAVELRDVRGHVRFEGVSFSYDKKLPVIRDIDIDAKPGETVALMGGIGSGKSTVVNLLPRFYDVTEGRITIDGVDIRDVTLESLRRHVGVVLQDAFLFNGTIRDNLAYGVPDATQEQIEEAARAARIHDFIVGLPDGYDTWVGERGITLSGGQKQRVAIARVLLRDPKILVLDDSTSNVDMETEYLIQQALQEVMKGRTTFVIAQRLRTVRDADQILVLKDGRIVERGRHEELIARDGIYRRIYDVQLRDQEEVARSQLGATAAAGS
ncbi:MAG TPA: ABC transporter ATP-binding protein [Dehalococcoidia bacterium]